MILLKIYTILLVIMWAVGSFMNIYITNRNVGQTVLVEKLNVWAWALSTILFVPIFVMTFLYLFN